MARIKRYSCLVVFCNRGLPKYAVLKSSASDHVGAANVVGIQEPDCGRCHTGIVVYRNLAGGFVNLRNCGGLEGGSFLLDDITGGGVHKDGCTLGDSSGALAVAGFCFSP